MLQKVDALGLPCPIPVVRAKQAIAALPEDGGTVQVWVDNHVATENLRKMAEGSGYAYAVEKNDPSRYTVSITVGSGQAQTPIPAVGPNLASYAAMPRGAVVAIGTDQMGRGSEELGRILIKGFIFSLTQLEPLPQAVLFFNSGVKLTLQDANTVDDLRTLRDSGCAILVCGTCVDFYQVREQLAVGEITNMLGIAEWMNKGAPLINL